MRSDNPAAPRRVEIVFERERKENFGAGMLMQHPPEKFFACAPNFSTRPQGAGGFRSWATLHIHSVVASNAERESVSCRRTRRQGLSSGTMTNRIRNVCALVLVALCSSYAPGFAYQLKELPPEEKTRLSSAIVVGTVTASSTSVDYLGNPAVYASLHVETALKGCLPIYKNSRHDGHRGIEDRLLQSRRPLSVFPDGGQARTELRSLGRSIWIF